MLRTYISISFWEHPIEASFNFLTSSPVCTTSPFFFETLVVLLVRGCCLSITILWVERYSSQSRILDNNFNLTGKRRLEIRWLENNTFTKLYLIKTNNNAFLPPISSLWPRRNRVQMFPAFRYLPQFSNRESIGRKRNSKRPQVSFPNICWGNTFVINLIRYASMWSLK